MSNKIICCVHPIDFKLNNAGSKAVLDVEDFASELGYETFSICNQFDNKYKRLKDLIFNKIKLKKILTENSILVVQYPAVYGSSNRYVCKQYSNYFAKKGVHTIAVIHDLECIREFKGTSEYDERVKEEIKNLNNFEYVISHNEQMTKFLKANGLTSKILNLEVFDYKCELSTKENEYNTDSIAFAGNLNINKSGFIYKLDDMIGNNVNIHLYGPNYDENIIKNKNVRYKGVCSPEELISKLNEKFGLIWDGEELISCTGKVGEYTRYNNPHKLSLYIAAGLPIIAWEEAAISKFIQENNIGISVSSLLELDEKLGALSQDDYIKMKNNISKLQNKVKDGYYIKRALKKIEDETLSK